MSTRSLRVAIAGAGNVGRSIARELLTHEHRVLLIEREERALKTSSVPGAQWLLGDACEVATLDSADLAAYDVMVAATGDDKANLVVSLLAKTEYGVGRVVARVNHPKNEWLFDGGWGVDVAVSTPRLLTALVDEAVSVGDLVRLLRFQQGSASLVEVTLPPDSPVAGRTLGEVELPGGTAVVAVLRSGVLVLPAPEIPLAVGDEVLALTTAPELDAPLAAALGADPGPGVRSTGAGGADQTADSSS